MGKKRITLRDVIYEQMHLRGIVSLREFAKHLGCDDDTVKRVVDGGIPQTKFMLSLSRYTHIGIDKLNAIAFPDLVQNVPSEIELIAQRLNALEGVERDIAIRFINGLLFKEINEGNDKRKGNGGKGKKPYGK